MADDFDEDDLEALRALSQKARTGSPAGRKKQADSGGLDGRRLRSPPPAAEPRSAQLNVRVRPVTKEQALEIARRKKCSVTEAVESAIEQLHTEIFGR